jgi:hypothetical protein
MGDVSATTFVRLSVELPKGVEVVTETTVSDHKVQIAADMFRTIDAARHKTKSNTPIVLTLEFPLSLSAEVGAALEKLRTVGRV